MARNARKARGKSNEPGARAGDPRRSRTIRFSDSEWQLVEDAALRQGISASQLVRTVMLAAVEERLASPAEATLTPGHRALWRSTGSPGWNCAFSNLATHSGVLKSGRSSS